MTRHLFRIKVTHCIRIRHPSRPTSSRRPTGGSSGLSNPVYQTQIFFAHFPFIVPFIAWFEIYESSANSTDFW